MKIKTHGSYTYKGVRVTVLSPPWVYALVQVMVSNMPVAPGDHARFVKWCREQARLERLQKRLVEAKAESGKAVVKILR